MTSNNYMVERLGPRQTSAKIVASLTKPCLEYFLPIDCIAWLNNICYVFHGLLMHPSHNMKKENLVGVVFNSTYCIKNLCECIVILIPRRDFLS